MTFLTIPLLVLACIWLLGVLVAALEIMGIFTKVAGGSWFNILMWVRAFCVGLIWPVRVIQWLRRR